MRYSEGQEAAGEWKNGALVTPAAAPVEEESETAAEPEASEATEKEQPSE